MCSSGGGGIVGQAPQQLMRAVAITSAQRSGTQETTKAAFDQIDAIQAEKAKTEQAYKDVETLKKTYADNKAAELKATQDSLAKAAQAEQQRRQQSSTLISGSAVEDDRYSIQKPRGRRATLLASDA
jgi:hypothetical protein